MLVLALSRPTGTSQSWHTNACFLIIQAWINNFFCAHTTLQLRFTDAHKLGTCRHAIRSLCLWMQVTLAVSAMLSWTDPSAKTHWRHFPKRSLYQWSKRASHQTSCIPGFRLCGKDMKATPVYIHTGCFHSPRSRPANRPAWQISAGCLVFSHHHSSPGESWMPPWMHMLRESKDEGGRERHKMKVSWGNHNENAKIELFSTTEGGVMRGSPEVHGWGRGGRWVDKERR